MAGSGALPVYQRFVNGVPVPPSRKTLRLREKYIIILVFFCFTTVCLCAFMYLPNFQEKVTMGEMRKHLQDTGDGLFVPKVDHGNDGVLVKPGKLLRHDDNEEDPHSLDDHKKLKGKIEKAWEQQQINDAFNKMKIDAKDADKLKDSIKSEKELYQKMAEDKRKQEEEERLKKAKTVEKDHDGHPGARGGEPSDPDVKAKRDKVREVRIE